MTVGEWWYAKRHAVRVHVDRTVSWDHSKLGGTY